MSQNVSQLTYLERSQKQKRFGTSFIKIAATVAELWFLKVLIICLFIGRYHYKTNENCNKNWQF